MHIETAAKEVTKHDSNWYLLLPVQFVSNLKTLTTKSQFQGL